MVQAIELRTGKPGLHCWKEPKMAHQKMVLKLLGSKTHVIVCLRAKRKSKQGKGEKGQTVIIKDEFFTPKQDGDFIFEMTVHAEVQADHTLRVTKVSHPALETVFRTGVKVSIETGKQLAAWAKGTAVAPAKSEPTPVPGAFVPYRKSSDLFAFSRKYLATATKEQAEAWDEFYKDTLAVLSGRGTPEQVAGVTEMFALYDKAVGKVAA
jgi:hypothetical protein